MRDLTPSKDILDPIEIASRDEIAALQLQRCDLVARGDLYWVENVFRRCQVTHYGLVLFVSWR